MPSTGMPSASLSSISASSGWRCGQVAGPLPDVVGEQQLAARRRPQPLDRGQRALVGDGEAADLLDLVAPELHPQRVLLGRREDVEDAAADGELAPLGDQVGPGVGDVGQPPHHRVELGASAPVRSSTGSRSPSPFSCGCSTDRTGATTTRSGPAAGPGGPAGAARPAAGRPCRCAGESRSCGSVSQAG